MYGMTDDLNDLYEKLHTQRTTIEELSATLAALSAENVVLSTTLDRVDEALHTMGQDEGLVVLRAKATLARRILKETAPIRQKSHIRTT